MRRGGSVIWGRGIGPDTFYSILFIGVPICASDCDNWYDACKDDRICVENVLEDYNRTVNYVNSCPRGAKCKTYAKMFGNGKNLCEKLWGDSYRYVKKDKDVNNCMKMWFTPGSENPNANVVDTGSSPSRNVLSSHLLLAVVYTVVALN